MDVNFMKNISNELLHPLVRILKIEVHHFAVISPTKY